MKTIYLAGGCFWGVQHYFDQFDGVESTRTGYANGHTEAPKYEEVKSQKTGHAETVKVDYDETKISLSELLDKYFVVVDPVSVNKQGEDEGIQYRSGIYYIDADDKAVIENKLVEVQKEYDKPLAVELKPLANFYDAEEFHQNYLDKHPDGYCHIPRNLFKK